MNEPYERLVQSLKSLPGLGYRSAEKIALHLLVEKPDRAKELCDRILTAEEVLGPCEICGNLTDTKSAEFVHQKTGKVIASVLLNLSLFVCDGKGGFFMVSIIFSWGNYLQLKGLALIN